MKKNRTIIIVLTVVIFSLLYGACNSVTAGAVYSLPIQKPDTFDEYPYGGFGFGASVDSEYVEITVDFYPWAPKKVNDDADMFSMGVYFKLPIDLYPVTLYPLVGADLAIGGLSAGAGMDFSLGERLFIRGEALYGFGMPFGMFSGKDLGEVGTLTARAGLGFRFQQGVHGAMILKADPYIGKEEASVVRVSPTYYSRLSAAVSDLSPGTIVANTMTSNRWTLIPSGRQTILGEYRDLNGGIAEGLWITYNFEPGHYYYVHADVNNRTVGLRIIDVTNSNEKEVAAAKSAVKALK